MRPFIVEMIQEAGEEVKKNFGRAFDKGKMQGGWKDFLTETDESVEKKLTDAIRSRFPDHRITAEESGLQEGNEEDEWLIDPLDGTGNFANGIPFFALSVAYRHKGRAVASVVYDPIHGECFSADELGAYLNDVRLSSVKPSPLNQIIVTTEIPPNQKKQREADRMMAALPLFFWQVRYFKSIGSTALELAYVAAGRVGAFVLSGLFYPWDIAAGAHIIEAAGGKVTSWSGETWKPEMTSIIAAVPEAHESLVEILRNK